MVSSSYVLQKKLPRVKGRITRIPPETNIFAPQNGWLEDEFPFWEGRFSGAMLVSGRVVDLPAIDVCLSPEQLQAQHQFHAYGFKIP